MNVEGLYCSFPGCRVTEERDGFLIDITVLCSPGEEGYAEMTQVLCNEHFIYLSGVLMALGFVSHNHHATNSFQSTECGGFGHCSHAAEYGPEIIQT